MNAGQIENLFTPLHGKAIEKRKITSPDESGSAPPRTPGSSITNSFCSGTDIYSNHWPLFGFRLKDIFDLATTVDLCFYDTLDCVDCVLYYHY